MPNEQFIEEIVQKYSEIATQKLNSTWSKMRERSQDIKISTISNESLNNNQLPLAMDNAAIELLSYSVRYMGSDNGSNCPKYKGKQSWSNLAGN